MPIGFVVGFVGLVCFVEVAPGGPKHKQQQRSEDRALSGVPSLTSTVPVVNAPDVAVEESLHNAIVPVAPRPNIAPIASRARIGWLVVPVQQP